MRIIEGGLTGDKTKVLNYAQTLANNLEQEGDERFARRIRSLLAGKRFSMATLDSLAAKPVDRESRIEMVDTEMVLPEDIELVLGEFLEKEVESVVAMHEKRDLLTRHGVDIPNSLLLYGPPGCGKTSIARLIAAKTGLPLITARLDGLVSSLLGSTAKNIRKVFDYAARQECVLFLDEFDVVAKRRDDRNELGELKRVVNSLLQSIDRFGHSGILIAATNHQDLLDPAVWRRFNKVIEVPLPNTNEVAQYAEERIEPLMTGCFKNRHLLALNGLSYSAMETAARNALCSSTLAGKEGFNAFQLIKETYLLKHHGIEDIDDFVAYLIKCGCTLHEIEAGTQISLRKIQRVSKSIKNGDDKDA